MQAADASAWLAVHGYIRRKLQRSTSETESQEQFSLVRYAHLSAMSPVAGHSCPARSTDLTRRCLLAASLRVSTPV